MRFFPLLALAASLGFSAAMGGNDDTGPIDNYFPPVCGNQCGPIVIEQKNCGVGSPNQIQCICNWQGHKGQAKSHIRGCEACIRIQDPSNNNLKGAQLLLNRCNFQPESASLSGFAAPTAAPMMVGGAAAVVGGMWAAM